MLCHILHVVSVFYFGVLNIVTLHFIAVLPANRHSKPRHKLDTTPAEPKHNPSSLHSHLTLEVQA